MPARVGTGVVGNGHRDENDVIYMKGSGPEKLTVSSEVRSLDHRAWFLVAEPVKHHDCLAQFVLVF